MARKGEISEDDFGHLMKDETFVDFFNVFLSLPSFSQRVMYMYDKKTFQFDPPLKRRQQVLEKQNLSKWLREERLPYFTRSEYYLEYLLCEQLMTIRPHLSTSSHDIDYEEFRILEDKTFVRSVIGHVVGMCQFRVYLADSPGEKILEFWKDAERFHRTRHRGLRRLLFREIQIKYYKPEGLTHLSDHSIWQALNDGATAAEFDLELDKNLPDLPASFRDLQNSVMTLLQNYWLQKYLLHHKLLRQKQLPLPDDVTKLQSLSDLRLLQDIKDIDKALAVVQGVTMPNKTTKAEGAKANWMSMFPGVEIDDTSSEDVVTSHSDGEVTLTRVGSEFEVMLEHYFESSSSSSGSSSQEELQWEVAPMFPTLTVEEVDHVQVTRDLVAQIADEEQRRKTLVTDNLALFEQLQGQNQAQGQPMTLYSEIDLPRPRTCESSEVRVKDEVKGTGSMHADLKLPSVKGSRGVKTPSRQRQKKIRRNLSSAVRSFDTRPPLSGDVPRPGEREPARITPVSFSYTNISEGNYRYDNKVLVRSLVSDLMCGRPFVAYLLRYRHEEEARRARLWEEIHTYLSLKTMVTQEPTATRLRHWRANQLILRFLNETEPDQLLRKEGCCPEFVKLPPGVSASVRKLIVLGKADSLLAHIQDYLSQSLHGLWKSYIHLDKETFMDSTIYNKPGGRIHRTRYVPAVPSMTLKRLGDRILPPLAQGTQCRGLRREAKSPSGGKPQGDKKQDNTKEGSEESTEEKPKDSEQGNASKDGNVKQAESTARPGAENKGMQEKAEKTEKTEEVDENGMLVTQEDHKGLLERRMWRALQLTAYVNNIDLEALLMDPLPVKELVYNGDDTSGSLTLKKLLIMRRRDLVEHEERRRAAVIGAYTNRLEKQQAKEVADMPAEVFDDNIPEWAKPFKGENKRWVYRPTRPRTMAEILRNPHSVEFFRRYLQAHGSAGQLKFWCDVESLKLAKDLTYRQQKINHILRRYFLSQKGYLSLGCNDDVIKEIPKMEKVTPAMLISGQSCIGKLLEEKWFAAYQATFPELEPVHEELTPELKEKKRQWTTDRSRALWIAFVRTVMRFRHSIMDKEMTRMFGMYLKNEIVKETDRQKAVGNLSYVPGLPIKKVIKNRLIDVTKLLNDLAFLGEAERFRTLCDNAAEAARQGTYRTEDQYMLDLKAKTIIMCYLDSEIPPKIQINASSEVADNILSTYQSGLVDRALFHDANMNIFPVMAYIWKKFQRMRFAQMLGMNFKGEEVPVVLEKANSINFMDINHADTKRVIAVHEDDPPRMLFSLSNGLRIITPPTREQLLKRALEATWAASGGRTSQAGEPSTRSMTMAALGDPHLQGSAGRNMSRREIHQVRQSRRRGSRGSLACIASNVSGEEEVNQLSLKKRRGAFSSQLEREPSEIQP